MKPPSHPDSLSKLLKGHSDLTDVLARAKFLTALADRVAKILPPDIKAHCQLANVRDKTVVMVCDDAAWSSRLRYYRDDILRHLQEEHQLAMTELKIKVTTKPAVASVLPAAAPISDKTSQHLKQIAKHQRDPELAAALKRLANRRS